jgi:hypothetical protein
MNESKTDTDFSQSTTSDFGTETFTLEIPERSEWTCWLMGDYGKSQHGAIVYHPVKGREPNWFHRKMQELCFGFQWRKN